jgi:hypothetical protein
MMDDLNFDDRIDATLRRLGSAAPRAGMEERVLARIAEAEKPSRFAVSRWFRVPDFALGAVAVLACVAIVTGSVNHSRHVLGPVPGLQMPAAAGGVGAASAVHVAAQPVAAAPQGRARSSHSAASGRARISPAAHKPLGVAVPKTPAASTSDEN